MIVLVLLYNSLGVTQTAYYYIFCDVHFLQVVCKLTFNRIKLSKLCKNHILLIKLFRKKLYDNFLRNLNQKQF